MHWHHRSSSLEENPDCHQLPEIDGGRCVQSRSLLATCQACVDTCPHSALVMDDEMLGFDQTACSGCGQCQAVCPQDAIQIGPRPPVKGKSALLACKKATTPGYEAREIACVHQFGLEQLARFHLDGVRHLVVETIDCGSCENRPEQQLGGHCG